MARRREGSGRETWTDWLSSAMRPMASNRPFLGGHHFFQRLGGPAWSRRLRLELCEPAAGGLKLRQLFAPQPWALPAEDQVLGCASCISSGRSRGDHGDVGDFPPGRNQIQDPASELRWVPPRHADLLPGTMGPTNQTTRLHRSGGTSALILTRLALQVFVWIEWSSCPLQALSTRR